MNRVKLDLGGVGLNINSDAVMGHSMPVVQLRADRIRVLYQQVRSVLIGNLLVAMLLTTFLYSYTNDILSVYWFVVVVVFSVIRYLLLRQYYRKERDDNDVIKWGWVFAITAFVSGCTWGVTSILFLQTDNLVVMVFLLMTLTGITVGSSASLSNFANSYYAFAIPTILPFGYVLSATGQSDLIILSLMLFVFLLLQLVVAKKNQATLDNSILLRNENAELVEQLEIKKDKAEKANSAKTRFLAAASHDLRQPLHAMSLLLSVLSEYKQGDEQLTIIEKIKRSSLSLESLLESLLDISKLDAGVINIEINPFKIQPLFDVLSDEFKPVAEEKGLDIQFSPSSVLINSDVQIIERILRNLISNAIRYTDQGKILVGCRQSESLVRLCVCDTGLGIDDSNKELIFEEFQQLNNHNRDRNKGLGLGLSIVKRLTELLGLTITLRSSAGKGSAFIVECPRSVVIEDDQKNSSQVISSYPKLAEKTIVIIDDEEEIRNALALLLNSWGCKTFELTCMDDVSQKLLPRIRPDMIITDYRLSNHETGVQVIAAIQSYYEDGDIPAVIITGDTSPERIKEAEESGFTMLHKPVGGGKLRAILNSLLLSK